VTAAREGMAGSGNNKQRLLDCARRHVDAAHAAPVALRDCGAILGAPQAPASAAPSQPNSGGRQRRQWWLASRPLQSPIGLSSLLQQTRRRVAPRCKAARAATACSAAPSSGDCGAGGDGKGWRARRRGCGRPHSSERAASSHDRGWRRPRRRAPPNFSAGQRLAGTVGGAFLAGKRTVGGARRVVGEGEGGGGGVPLVRVPAKVPQPVAAEHWLAPAAAGAAAVRPPPGRAAVGGGRHGRRAHPVRWLTAGDGPEGGGRRLHLPRHRIGAEQQQRTRLLHVEGRRRQ